MGRLFKPTPMVVVRYDGKCVHFPSVKAVAESFGKSMKTIYRTRTERNGYIMSKYKIMREDEWSLSGDYHFNPRPTKKKKRKNSMPRTEEYCKIQSEKAKKNKPWTYIKKHPCMCLTTGEIFPSRQAAAERYGLKLSGVKNAIQRHCKTGGYAFINIAE